MKDKIEAFLPAEWVGKSAVLLSWPHEGTDWQYMLHEVQDCYIHLIQALTLCAKVLLVSPYPEKVAALLTSKSVESKNIKHIKCPTNDTWARDFGMICTLRADGTWIANDFKFNGWGLKFAANHDNLITRNIIASGALNTKCKYSNHLGFVLEGGSIDISPDGSMMTTTHCLLSPNRNGEMSQLQIEEYLKNTFSCKNILWLNHGDLEGDDTDSHIDTLARFLPGDMIAYSSCNRVNDSHYCELKEMESEIKAFRTSQGLPYTLIDLPIPEAIYDEDGLRLPATYANFLIINNKVFLPIYGDNHYDQLAINKIKAALPLYEVIPVNCRALIQQHGSLHCITMQFPEEIVDWS